MGSVPICICKNKEDIENNKKVVKVNMEEEKEEEEKNIDDKLFKKKYTSEATNQRKLILNSEKHTKRNDQADKSTVHSIEKNHNVSVSSKEINKLNVKLRSKITKKTHGRRSVFLNRTSVNIIIFGDKEVGKTSYANKLKDNSFNEKYIPTNINEEERFICKAIKGERTYHLNIAIINNINDIKEELKRQIDYFLIFYDMNNENSIDFGINIFENYLKSEINNGSNISLSHVIFIGNKYDLNNNINCKISQICDEFKINHFEISIKENYFIDEMKNKLTEAFDNDEFQSRK